MRSARFLAVIFMAICLSFSVRADSVALSGGPGDLTPVQFAALGLVEDPKSCSNSRKTSSVYLAPASFPVAETRGKARVELGDCDVYSESAFHEQDRMTKIVGTITAPSLLEIACVAAAQKVFQTAPTDTYRSCPSGETKMKGESPCRSEDFVTNTTRAFNLVSECLGVDRRDLFRIASENTGLVPGAITPQIESGAASVRDTDLGLAGGNSARAVGDRIRKSMGANAFCAGLYQIEQTFIAADEKSVCERMGQPAGAVLPLLVQAKSFLYLKADLEASLRTSAARAKFGSEAEFQNVLLRVAHSGSVAGEVKARAVFSTLLLRPFKGATDFLAQYGAALSAVVPDPVRAELATLSERFDSIAKDVHKSTGGRECF